MARQAGISLLRWGVLFGGLVIIADLSAHALSQRAMSQDDQMFIAAADEIVNYVLFSILGVVVARDTGLIWLGAMAGVFASTLDGIVVVAAATMAPPAGQVLSIEDYFARNLTIGVLFSGISGAMYVLVRRWSNGQRSR